MAKPDKSRSQELLPICVYKTLIQLIDIKILSLKFYYFPRWWQWLSRTTLVMKELEWFQIQL